MSVIMSGLYVAKHLVTRQIAYCDIFVLTLEKENIDSNKTAKSYIVNCTSNGYC
jgi:hypothetical protein